MIDAPLGLAFTAGLVATVNPCGFAMLPAYLSYFLGLDDDAAAPGATGDCCDTVGNGQSHAGVDASLSRALVVGAVVSAGFLLVFGVTGALVTVGIRSFIDYVPWVAIIIGIALAALGVAMLRGFHLSASLPRLERGGRSRRYSSVFAFGVSYAVASLSCTLPVFLAVVASTVTRTNFTSGLATFLAYGLGMALVLVAVTVALALAKHSLVTRLRGAMRHVDRVAGALLVVAGAYIVYYWVFSLSTTPGTTTGAGPARFVEGLSADASRWLSDWGAVVGVALTGVIVVTAGYLLLRRYEIDDEFLDGDDGDELLAHHTAEVDGVGRSPEPSVVSPVRGPEPDA